MRCQHCGHEVPEGSAFCNHCGYRISDTSTYQTCSYCHQQMPKTSVFCPHCGKAVDNAMSVAQQSVKTATTAAAASAASEMAAKETAATPRPAQPQVMEEQRRAAQRRAMAQPTRPVNPDPDDDDDDDDGNEDGEGRSNFNRNLIIGIVLAAVLIGLLSMLKHCNNQENNDLKARADSAAIFADNSQDASSILSAELSRNNFTEDGATIGCAVKFAETDPDTPDRIVGVTYKNDADRPFIKIYQLTRDGGGWKTELGQTKYYDERNIVMDNSSLIADQMYVPRKVTVDGKQCLYFAFLNHLKSAGEGSNGRVVLALYDLEGKKLTTLTYDGPIRSRSDARQYVYSRAPLESINNSERQFLQQEAVNIGAIRIATQEEIDAEEEAKEKEEEEKALAGEENADAKWNNDNAENVDKLKEGNEVQMKPTQYDKPIFGMDDIKEKVEIGNYLVFLDKKGTVYGFNKNSRKYFTIYAASAQGISKSGESSVNIKTANGNLNYDLVHDKAKAAN